MAIDTAEKRKNVASLYPFLPVGVTPNSDKDAGWRAQAGWGYSLQVVFFAVVRSWTLASRSTAWTVQTRSTAWTLQEDDR